MRRTIIIIVLVLIFSAGCAKKQTTTYSGEPKEIQLRIDLAETYIMSGKLRQSLKELSQVAEQAKDIPRYYYDLGLVYLGLGQLSDAEINFEQAARLNPDYGKAWNNLGKVEEEQKKYEQAANSYTKALNILTYMTPELPAYNLAKMYLSLQKPQKALYYAKLSTQKNWRYIPGYLLTAQILNNMNQPQQAQIYLQKGAEADLSNNKILFALAENLIRLGKTQEAITWFKRIIENDSKSEEAKLAQDYMELML